MLLAIMAVLNVSTAMARICSVQVATRQSQCSPESRIGKDTYAYV